MSKTGYEFPKPFIRQGAFPLDASSIFDSLEQAKNYVNNNPISYIGQLISVVDKSANSVELYMVGFSGSIIKISGLTSIGADDKSIVFQDGKLSLYAFDLIQSEGLSIRTKADGKGGYILEWFDLNITLKEFEDRLSKIELELANKVNYSDAIDEESMQNILDEILNINKEEI